MTLNDKYTEMTATPVRRLVLRLAVPTVVSMMVTSLYNIVDAAFVGHLSTEATAGIGVSLAYMIVVQALGFFFGHGSGNYISRELGAQRHATASTMASVGFFTPLLLGIGMAVGFGTHLPQLARLLGATPDVVPFAAEYLRYIVYSTPLMMTALTLNNQLRLQGNARYGMVGIVAGAVLNIVLDALFIPVLGWGVTGASLATAASQTVSFGLLLWGTTRDGSVHLSLRQFRPSWRAYYEILMGGLPSLCRQVFNCTSAICLNYAAARYAPAGQEASVVAAFAVVTRTMMFAFSFVLGINQGFQPVAGFNYGARRYDRVRLSYLFTASLSVALLLVISAAGFIFAPQVIRLYRDQDPVMLAVGIEALRYQCASFTLIGFSTTTNMLFQVIRMPIRSTLISIGRQGLFFLPALFVLPLFWGLQGVMLTQPVADAATFLFSIPFAVWITRRLSRLAAEGASE